jgi:hypothetical protein
VPQPVATERHRAGYRWRERFPDAAPVLDGEGGRVYAAEVGRALWVIGDERAAASLLGDDDAVLAVSLSRYTDRERWVADVVGVRDAHARAINREPATSWPGPFDGALLISSTAPHTGSSASPASSSSSRSTSNRTCSPRARRSCGASQTSGTTIRRSRRRPGSRSKRGPWGTSTSLSSRPARRGRSSNSIRGRAGRYAPSEAISSCSTGGS